MKKTFRLLTLTAVMAVTASLAVPAFAATPDADREKAPSMFLSLVFDNSPSHIVVDEPNVTPADPYTWSLFTLEKDLKDDNK